MTRWSILFLVLLIPAYAGAILGDLNKDGQVDFGDFFLFADQFGKKGPPDPPDTIIAVRIDTLRQIARDTIIVTKIDTVRSTVRDTVTLSRIDTLQQVVELIRRDTIKVIDESRALAQVNFGDRNDLATWIKDWPWSEAWQIENGKLIVRDAGSLTGLTFPTSFAGDLDISVDVRWIRGGNASFGFEFRSSSLGRYRFAITSDRYFTTNPTVGIGGFNFSSFINEGSGNTLRAVVRGNRFSFFINGNKVAEANDSNLIEGQVVLRAGANQEISFDNLIIARPEQVIEHEVVVRDTVRQIFRDTLVTTRTDTMFIASDSNRPPIQSWSTIATEAEPAVYWLGVSTATSNSTLFLGTGFAYSGTDIATNAHVAIGLIDLANRLEAIGAVPIIVAIRSRTFAYGSGTYILSRGATIHPDYDGTVNSADVADLLLHSSETKRFPTRLRMAPRTAILGINTGDEIATLGFPGELETEILDALLQPIPTFKTASVSALRPYRSSIRSWRVSNKIVQHSLDLTPGTSGSPILNNRGEVIAINNAGVTGTSLGFAIRADELREMLEADKIDYPSLYADLRLKKTFLPALNRGLDSRSLLDLLAGSR